MQIHIKVSDAITVVGEGDSHTDAFDEVASLADAFKDIDVCGVCGSCWKDGSGNVTRWFGIQPVHREVDGNDFYEMQCKNFKCRAKLSFSQNKKGRTIFARRKAHAEHALVRSGKLKEGDYLPNNGWEIYVKPDDAKSKK